MIKYHDNTQGIQYGDDHQLTNNWNPDLDYGNEYANVYFRIETKGYSYPSFHLEGKDRESFEEDIRKVFTSLGWKCKKEAHNGVCSTWINGKSHLYLHPQNFSGEVLKNEIKMIAESLQENASFQLRWVDLYETVYDMTDSEYEEILSQKDEDIKNVVLAECKTTRNNKFHSKNHIVRIVSDKFRLRRVGEHDGRNYGIDQTGIHISNIINSLIEFDLLVKCVMNNDIYVRTINKTEQKKKKLFISE